MCVQGSDDASGVVVGVPPGFVPFRECRDHAGWGVGFEGAFSEPGVVEVMKGGEFLLPRDGLLAGGDACQVQSKTVEGFVLNDFWSTGGDPADVALDVDLAALQTAGGPFLPDRCQGSLRSVSDDHQGCWDACEASLVGGFRFTIA